MKTDVKEVDHKNLDLINFAQIALTSCYRRSNEFSGSLNCEKFYSYL